MLPYVTLEGNLTADVEVRFSQAGKAWASFGVACSDRVRDPQGNWTQGDPTFIQVKVFGQTAENVAATLSRGSRVVVSGRWKQDVVEKDGVPRRYDSVIADSVAAGLAFTAYTEQDIDPVVAGTQSDPFGDTPPF